MLRRDGGVELLNKLIESPGCPDNILRLCDLTLAKAYDPNIGSDIEETWWSGKVVNTLNEIEFQNATMVMQLNVSGQFIIWMQTG